MLTFRTSLECGRGREDRGSPASRWTVRGLDVGEEIADGDTTSYRWSCAATYTGESALLPVPPTGSATTATGRHFIHWDDGQPVEVWHNGDWLGWLQRCGVVPALG